MSLQDRYIAHYAPLIKEFSAGCVLPDTASRLPEPFLPLYGRDYENSALRIAFVGQDTCGWGNLRNFIQVGAQNPGQILRANMDEFHETFWGFVMMFLAGMHGIKDWSILKRRQCREVLSSFAWGNGNSIEYWGSSSREGIIPDDWHRIRQQGQRFDGVHHLVKTLAPHVIVVLWKAMHPPSYFSGYDYQMMGNNGGVIHYHLSAPNIHVLHVPHPQRMNFEAGPDAYHDGLLRRLRELKMLAEYPRFAEFNTGGAEISEHLLRLKPAGIDGKYAFVEWVANELRKRDSFMTVPCLAELLNRAGYRVTAVMNTREAAALISF